jgi:hypothetical protein
MEITCQLPILSTVARVVDHRRKVSFHQSRIASAVDRWGHLLKPAGSWDHPCHYHDQTAETVRWIFTVDILNHCFWPDAGEVTWGVEYHGEIWSGYWGLAASLKRAMEAGIPVSRGHFLAEMSRESLESIFRGQGRIPLFDQRLENLREAGRVLDRDWAGDIVNLVEDARGSAVHLATRVVDSFPSFRDEALYEGDRVYFWKRAQLFASDLYHAFRGQGWGALDDIDVLTAFADYKLPQVLRALGILSYQPDLEQTIDGLLMIDAGSVEEVEIRAMTIWAVEEIRHALCSAGRPVTSAAVDHWLWQLGQLELFRQKPYHRCRTIYY